MLNANSRRRDRSGSWDMAKPASEAVSSQSDKDALPLQLQRLLNAAEDAARWEVLNAGVSSYNVWDY